MPLRVATAALFIFGVLLLCSLMVLMPNRPPAEELRAVKIHGLRTLILFLTTILVWFGAAVCAYLSIRTARRELAEMNERNLRELIEGTLKDHEPKPTQPNGSPPTEPHGSSD